MKFTFGVSFSYEVEYVMKKMISVDLTNIHLRISKEFWF